MIVDLNDLLICMKMHNISVSLRIILCYQHLKELYLRTTSFYFYQFLNYCIFYLPDSHNQVIMKKVGTDH